ncbi:MAG: hypothetical protein ACO1N9_09430 [Flavobacterium sp.]
MKNTTILICIFFFLLISCDEKNIALTENGMSEIVFNFFEKSKISHSDVSDLIEHFKRGKSHSVYYKEKVSDIYVNHDNATSLKIHHSDISVKPAAITYSIKEIPIATQEYHPNGQARCTF